MHSSNVLLFQEPRIILEFYLILLLIDPNPDPDPDPNPDPDPDPFHKSYHHRTKVRCQTTAKNRGYFKQSS